MRWEDSLAKSLEALNLMREADYPSYEIPGRFWASTSLIGVGELARAKEVAWESLAVAERLGHRTFSQVAFWTNEALARIEGNWAEARDLIERGLRLNPQEGAFLVARAHIEYEVGDLQQGQEYLDRLIALVRAGLLNTGGVLFLGPVALTIAVIARITGVTAQLEEASDLFDGPHDAAQPSALEAVYAGLSLGMVAVAREDAGLAREQYARLLGTRVAGFEIWAWASYLTVSHVLGLLSHTTGDLDKASEHFEDAVAFCRKGYRPELAWTCCDYADTLLQRNQSGDREKAMSLLDESLAISSDLGMRPLMERVLSRKMSLQGIDVSSPQTSIDAVVSAVEIERPNLQPHAAPDGTVTLMFTDIENFTPINERLGDELAQKVLHTHNAIIRRQLAAHQGFEVKSQGDGVHGGLFERAKGAAVRHRYPAGPGHEQR